MFLKATTFNQDVSSWNVSSGTDFVRNGQGIQFDALCLLIWLLFQVGFRVKFITEMWLLTQPILFFTFFSHVSLICLMRLLPLIKTFALGDLMWSLPPLSHPCSLIQAVL
jgi:hypothetical protein